MRRVGDETFRLCREYVDEFMTVDTDQICAAIRDIFEDTRSIVEPAGGLAVAAAKKYVAEHGLSGQTLVTISCGANVNFDRLRHIAERAAVGEQTEIASGTGSLETDLVFHPEDLSTPVTARYLRFYVDGYDGSGGGLNEIQVQGVE